MEIYVINGAGHLLIPLCHKNDFHVAIVDVLFNIKLEWLNMFVTFMKKFSIFACSAQKSITVQALCTNMYKNVIPNKHRYNGILTI